jgi:membrane protein YqaA with SNARE-associated domain
VGTVLILLPVAFASALIPLINIEAYLGLQATLVRVDHVWLLGLVAACGQMLGKVVWYHVGARSLGWSWVRRRIEQPKHQARLERWQSRTEERPVLAGLLLFASALTGLPPFAIVSVLAGQLRMNPALFFTVGLAGRWLRFTAVLGGLAWVAQLLER